ncbi:MAG: YfcC family protein [Chitinophagaceae bacterium]|nr:YfcC family protein [Chitinophagaceae bacterium]MCW5904426.1 YfcC family protein [Chitinophagaceae bacterium]
MPQAKKILNPITILLFVIVIAALATWFVPAGSYHKLAVVENEFVIQANETNTHIPLIQQSLDSLHILIPVQKFINGDIKKPISIPNTYHFTESKKAGFLDILKAPLKGIYEAIDIILLILVMGGFINIFNETGAMFKGITYLSYLLKGKEQLLIIILTALFSFGGSSYGMAEETLVFYPVLVPLFLAAGYDLLVPVAVIFGGSQIGGLSSFSNPFSTIIGSNAAGLNWVDGIYERIIMYVLSTALLIWYILRYAKKVKGNTALSLVLKYDGEVQTNYQALAEHEAEKPSLSFKTLLLLFIFIASFISMIAGVIFFDWWLLEITTLFFGASLLLFFITKVKENEFIQQFIKGAESLLAVAFIVGIARGVTIVLNEGNISDSLLYYTSNVIGGLPPALFIIILLGLFILLTLFISSSSGMAVLTMPILGALALIVHVPGKEIVNSYLYGMGIMGFITPTGLFLPSLAMVNVSAKTWFKFITPFLVMLFILCTVALLIGIYR